jgi:hypothetical protein
MTEIEEMGQAIDYILECSMSYVSIQCIKPEIFTTAENGKIFSGD